VGRDVTQYASLFEQSGNASLAIPNVVDSTYTGVLYISANLTFVSAPTPAPALPADGSRTIVAPILNPLAAGGSPFDAMGVSGGGNVSGTLAFPSRDVVAARVDLYASGRAWTSQLERVASREPARRPLLLPTAAQPAALHVCAPPTATPRRSQPAPCARLPLRSITRVRSSHRRPM
jgi:hypothetical protein